MLTRRTDADLRESILNHLQSIAPLVVDAQNRLGSQAELAVILDDILRDVQRCIHFNNELEERAEKRAADTAGWKAATRGI